MFGAIIRMAGSIAEKFGARMSQTERDLIGREPLHQPRSLGAETHAGSAVFSVAGEHSDPMAHSLLAPPPMFVVPSKKQSGLVTSLQDFQSRYPDAPPRYVAAIADFYDDNVGSIQILTQH